MKYKIEYRSSFQRPEYFETDCIIECNEIILNGHQQQYLVYLNNEKQSPTIYKINNKQWTNQEGYINQ